MGKKDFDIEFDFDDEFGFDPKSFLGTEDYDKDTDLNAFSDEELGLTSQDASESAEDTAAEMEDFDLDEDLDLDDFLNMGSEDEETEEEVPEDAESEEEYAEEESEYEDAYDEDPELPEEEAEETDMDENMEYTEDEELLEEPVYEEDDEQEEVYEFEEDEEEYEDEDEEDDEEEAPRKQRVRKERKPIQLPKITLPKLKTPNIFTKFYDLYFAPVLDKNWVNPEDPPQDPEKPRRRRKTKVQIFKEVYLPPLIACVCLVLVLSFVIGSLSDFIAQKQNDKAAEQSRLESSISAAELADQAAKIVAEEAERLAAGYDYQGAIDLLDSLGELTNYPELATKRAEYFKIIDSLVPYKDPSLIPNLSFHVLIEDMARAKKDTEFGGLYNRNFVTTSEFSKILQQLYDNGYVLVDFDSFVGTSTDINGNQKYEVIPMNLPADKKPVMITQTMLNYFNYMVDGNGDNAPDAQGDGFANKLVLDANGDIKAEYITAEGQTVVGNYDLVPILEDFIKQHPDFSYQGARAILTFTGHEGIFGYRCNTEYISGKSQEYYDNEVAGAKKIADALRSKGYTLGSYTYKNTKYADMGSTQIQTEMTKWNQEVTSVIGPVDVFVFAQQSNLTDYTGASFKVMYEQGFRFFISNATTATTATTTVNETYVRQNRLMVTGNSLAWNPSWFTGLFNCSAVLDSAVRGDVPN